MTEETIRVEVPWPADLEWTPEVERFLRARLADAAGQFAIASLPESVRDLLCTCQDREGGRCDEGLDCEECEVCQAEAATNG